MSGGRRAYDRSDSALSRRVAARGAARQEASLMGDTGKSREQRLAAALRENLKRRKAQARATEQKPEPPPVSED